jgi:hypothetical protein
MSISAAIAALAGATGANATMPAASYNPATEKAGAIENGRVAKVEPNVFMSIGNDLLGLMVTKGADGTVVADHYSHYSHSSHSSHSSHYSSR